MARIICIDYGGKRTGLAVTDPLQIIATALATIESKELIPYLKNYFQQEQVELILIGEPLNLDDSATHATPLVHQAIQSLKKNFPKYLFKLWMSDTLPKWLLKPWYKWA
jgi:putative Holliday junction resolvase